MSLPVLARSRSFLPAVAAALLLLAVVGCSRDSDSDSEPTVGAGAITETGLSRVRIEVRSDSDTSGNTGTFTMSGAMEDSGRFTTVDNRDEGGLDRTFAGAEGELVLHVQLLRVGPGIVEFEWSIRSGSGEYEGVRGAGTGEHRLSGGRLEGVLTGTLEP